jgi:hypothetical protein
MEYGYDKLGRLEQQVALILQEIKHLNENLEKTSKEHDAAIEQLKIDIHGNGKPGLKTDMAILKDGQKRAFAVAGGMAIILGGEMAALLFAILTHRIPLP